ncbi:MAG: hypothetical protein AB1567_00245 [bacterium]
MKRIILTFIFIGIASQVLAKEKGKIQEDEFGTKPMLSYLAEDATFLDEMEMKLLLTPEQMGKVKMIIKAEKDEIVALRQKWMDILKDEKLSVEQRREKRNDLDKKVVEIAKETKRDMSEILTPFQYKNFIPWINQKWTQAWTPLPKPQNTPVPSQTPFKDALQKDKELKELSPASPTKEMTESQKEATDAFLKAIESQSEDNQDWFSEDNQQASDTKVENPFEELLEEESEGSEDFFTSEEEDESLSEDPFEEALREHSEEKKE